MFHSLTYFVVPLYEVLITVTLGKREKLIKKEEI